MGLVQENAARGRPSIAPGQCGITEDISLGVLDSFGGDKATGRYPWAALPHRLLPDPSTCLSGGLPRST